jgi:tetratricopeptide (TPR) repeat protein
LTVVARDRGDVGAVAEALARIERIGPMAHVPSVERWLAAGGTRRQSDRELLARFTGEYPGQELLELGLTYAAWGRAEEARSLMALTGGTPVEPLSRAWLAHATQNSELLGGGASVEYVFPFRREMLPVLAWASDASDNWSWTYLYELALSARDRPDEAAPVLRGLGDRPNYAPAFTTRALLAGAHDSDRERDLRQAIELDPAERLLRIPLVQHLQTQGSWREALDESAAALDRSPDDFDLALLHAKSLNQLGLHDQSLEIMGDIRVLPSEHSREAQQLFSHAHIMSGMVALEGEDPATAVRHFEAAMTWPERLGQGRPYEPEECLPRFMLGLAQAGAGDLQAASRTWTAVADATPLEVYRGGDAVRLDLLGALSVEALGRGAELDEFGNGQEGAMARLVQRVRTAAQNGSSVVSAVAEAAIAMDDLFGDMEGRLLRRSFAAAAANDR